MTHGTGVRAAGLRPGHRVRNVARGQISRTGEKGAGLALAGLVLGWRELVLGIIALVAFVALRG